MQLALLITVLLALLACMFIVRQLRNQFNWSAEISRKAVHIAMGLTCTSFYWLFNSALTVWLLAGLATAMLLFIRYRTSLSSVLHEVQRPGFGEVYFALAVAVLFSLAQEAYLYVLPLLILTFADAAAATIGQRFGSLKFTTFEGQKSVEGSLAFAGSTFVLVTLLLATMANLDWLSIVVIGLMLALLLTLFEGASWRGLDNLIIPLTCYFLLSKVSQQEDFELLMDLQWAICCFVSFIWLRKKTLLDGSALLAVVLIAYFSMTLGGPIWFMAATIFLVAYSFFAHNAGHHERYVHSMGAFVCVTALPIGALVLQQITPHASWQLLWLYTFTVQLGLTGMARNSGKIYTGNYQKIMTTAMQGWALIFMPLFGYLHWQSFLPGQPLFIYTLLLTALALVLGLAANFAFALSSSFTHTLQRNTSRWLFQGGIGAATSISFVGLHYWLMLN